MSDGYIGHYILLLRRVGKDVNMIHPILVNPTGSKYMGEVVTQTDSGDLLFKLIDIADECYEMKDADGNIIGHYRRYMFSPVEQTQTVH